MENKLESGKVVKKGSKVYYVSKDYLDIAESIYESSFNLKENEYWSVAFATREEAVEWLANYKSNIVSAIEKSNYNKLMMESFMEKHKGAPVISKEECEKIFNKGMIEKQLNTIKPDYYKSKSGQDVLDVIDDFGMDFYAGNIFKYIVRAGKKDNESMLKDLGKAKEYLDRKIMLEI